MTATSARPHPHHHHPYPVKGILVNNNSKNRHKRASCGISVSAAKRNSPPHCLMNGKLWNLRNYYARRRPSIQAPRQYHQQHNHNSNNRIVVSPPRQHVCVQFHPEKNRVHFIPSRKSYTKTERLALWTPKKQLKQLILKNYREHSHEGRDWRHAPEEDQFVTLEGHDEPVHPVYAAQQQQQQEETAVPEAKATVVAVSPPPLQATTKTVPNKRKNRLSLRKLPLANNKLPLVEDDCDYES